MNLNNVSYEQSRLMPYTKKESQVPLRLRGPAFLSIGHQPRLLVENLIQVHAETTLQRHLYLTLGTLAN